MRIDLLLFARARDLAGSERITLDLSPGTTVAEMKRRLQAQYPPLRSVAGKLLVAVNNDYADDDHVIPDGAEVACFPPVSGG